MKLYHGTSSINLASIMTNGLKDPFLTDKKEIAQYYAECSCEDLGGNSCIIELDVTEDLLCYDGNAMDEPVMSSIESRDLMWEKAEMDHPEWIKDGMLIIPEYAYIYSLQGVRSVWAKGTFYPKNNPEKLLKKSEELEALVEKIHRNKDDLYEDGDLLERINCVDQYELKTMEINLLNQNEWGFDDDLIEEYAKLPDETMPPIIVHEYSAGNYSIVDGIHRLNACIKKGYKTIKAYVGKRY